MRLPIRPDLAVRASNAADGSSHELLVRKGGLEPPWVAPPDPKSGSSANFATFAFRGFAAFTGCDHDNASQGSPPAI
jgi:hypothetical protein